MNNIAFYIERQNDEGYEYGRTIVLVSTFRSAISHKMIAALIFMFRIFFIIFAISFGSSYSPHGLVATPIGSI